MSEATVERDIWDDPDDVPEPERIAFGGIPDGLNLLVRTTDATDKDTLHPSIKPVEWEGREFYMLKIPMVILGGEAKLDPKFVGWKVFTEWNVEKPTAERLEANIAAAKARDSKAAVARMEGQLKSLDKFPCGPELYNLMLDALAPEEGPAADRWAKVKAILAAKGRSLGYTGEMFKGNTQYMYAKAFQMVLMDSKYNLIGRTYTPKKKPGKKFEPKQTLGSIGADTPEERKVRKVALIVKGDEDTGF